MYSGLHEKLKVKQAFGPISLAAGTYFNGVAAGGTNGIDCRGEEEALVVVNVGLIAATGTCAVSLHSADVNDSSDASLAAVADKDGTEQALAAMADTADNQVWVMRVRVKDIKRYLFVKVVTANAASLISASVVFSGRTTPVTQDNTVITAAKHL